MRFLYPCAGLLLLSAATATTGQPSSAGITDPLTFVKKGVADNAKGDYAGALDAFNHALELNPLDPAAFEGRGETHLAQGDLSDAINDFTKALTIEPQDEASLHFRAAAETKLGNEAAAIADATQALQAGSPNAGEAGELYLLRGRAKFCQGDNAGALADANAAIQAQAHPAPAFFLRGVAENAVSNPSAADDFAKAAQAGMPEAALWYWLAKMEAHAPDDAAAQLPTLLAQAARGHPDPWIAELGDLLLQKTTGQQIISDLPTADKDETKAEQGWFFLGVAREFSSDAPGAKDAYQHVVTIGPADSLRVAESRRRLKILTS